MYTSSVELGTDAMESPTLPTRLFFIRHGKQIGVGERTAAERSDPPLSDQGHAQAAQLSKVLAAELTSVKPLLIASSPMRRALMTATPSAAALKATLLVHGACFEYGCAGTAHFGSGRDAIHAISPNADLTHIGPNGEWEYTGSSSSETEEEAKQRAKAVVAWLRDDVVPRHHGGAALLFAHQTFLDLVLQLLLTGSDAAWTYGMPRHKLSHAGVARVVAHADGRFIKES